MQRTKWCSFCGANLTNSNRKKDDKTCRWYCVEGANSCWKRYQRVLAQMKPRALPKEKVISFHKNKRLVEAGERGRRFKPSRGRTR